MSATFQILLDFSTDKPALEFDRYAQSFKEIIEQSPPRFAIGVYGGWGSGKTTLMQTIKTASTIGKVIHSLVAGLGMKVGIPGTFEISIDANKALTQAKEIEDEDAKVPQSFYHASFNALHDAFSEFTGGDAGRRIVVFVDDLDRKPSIPMPGSRMTRPGNSANMSGLTLTISLPRTA
jgi:hypothetical protein